MLSMFICYREDKQVVAFNYADARLGLRCHECVHKDECDGPDTSEEAVE